MKRSTRSPDKHSYLVDQHKSRSRSAFKFSSSLGAFVALGALSIWAFTPVSEEANYKPDRPAISNSITAATELKKVEVEITAENNNIILPRISNIDDLVLDAEADGYLKLVTFGSPGPKVQGSQALEPELEIVTLPESENVDLENEAEELQFASIDMAPIAGPKLSTGPVPEAKKTLTTSTDVKTFKIKSGDTLTRIFSNAKLPISQAINLAREESAKKLNRLSIGKTLRIYYDENKQLKSLEYDLDKLNTMIVTNQAGAFDIHTHEKQVEYRTFTAQGTIESSLGAAAEIAGISPAVANDLIDIYKWEIDFARNLHKGDRFSVIYQKAYIEDQYIANGPILAASFSTGGRTIEAVRYTDSNDVTAYFQPNGESLRRGFLRSPVNLARITSGFGKRLHPIQKTWKKHKGVDYGARRGSPILATADGVVQYAGKKGGYGNTVILRHGGTYTTLYAHMSKVGKGVRSGKSVAQGQVIGYVGNSGWATGDHLHYEFRVNGQHKDPLKVKLPKNLPLAKQEQEKFSEQADIMLATLASLKGTQVAQLEPEQIKPTL